MEPNPAWQGPIAFHEMLFGSWLAYMALILIWAKLLKAALPEWKYLMLTCAGGSFFVINHYYNYAPFYPWLIGGYSVVYFVLWYWLGIRPQQRPVAWRAGAMFCALVFTALYIGFELTARLIVSQGLHESWLLAAVFAGLMGVILARGRMLSDSIP